MTKSKPSKPRSMPTSIMIDPEVEAQLLWLSLNQRPDRPGNLSGVIRKLASDACKQLLDDGGSEKTATRWITARLRGRPLSRIEQSRIKQSLMQRVAALR